MKLVGFSVSKFRSITRAHRLPISNSTILIGQNNEGKSNLLAALTAAMTVVEALARAPIVRGRVRISYFTRQVYEWERDFPISLQETQPNGESVFRLEFQLSEGERRQFRRQVGSALNESLPIEIHLGRGDPLFKVVKRGRGAATLNRKRREIATFIGNSIEYIYIPAVRTAEAALEVVRDMVNREMEALQNDEEYQLAVAAVAELQRPTLDGIARRITEMLQGFVPSIRRVEVAASDDARYRALRRAVDIIIDDGTPTSIERKGDGVQSLAAIGLLRGTDHGGRDLILALEEPEAHLHPSAIHRLRQVLQGLSEEHQVVLSTHCPVFADRIRVGSNIIVQSSRANPATDIREVRDVLGVRASDNLRHAALMCVVEGETDRIAIQALLADASTALSQALAAHLIAIETLGGVARLRARLAELQHAICAYYVFLDADEAGRSAVREGVEANLLDTTDYTLATVPGQPHSELEDLYKREIYEGAIEARFGVRLAVREFRNNRKWSERMRNVFHSQGKIWDDATKGIAKTIVAEAVSANPSNALHGSRRASFDSMVQSLESIMPIA